ncbi:MAG: hypothetical protein KGL39_42555 [Patescibacteria group bacterium]|nr:hypothetical protein [Patescibacteria group bacterium]
MSWTGSERQRREQGLCSHAPGFADKTAQPRGTNSFAGESIRPINDRWKKCRSIRRKVVFDIVPEGTQCYAKRLSEADWRPHRTKGTWKFSARVRKEGKYIVFQKGTWLLKVKGGLIKQGT